MPPKDLGPLLSAQKEADVLKKKVAQVIKESNKTLDNRKLKDKEEKLKELYKNCLDVKQEVTVLLEKVKSLTEDQEPKKLKRYVAMKNQEVNRIDVWQNQLTNTMSKLLPNEIEEEYLK
ncbi:uncharacterized protein LOC121370093 [Gigantopelta aegis]|uniref:uncharacterized protein LOC121370093 n=1 Tax=Gigantopelta aegis TaxID=1735272 RepID=UPI001B888273|nr:uncharacterized protein LOC121370093 [Gigantopelta aegis]